MDELLFIKCYSDIYLVRFRIEKLVIGFLILGTGKLGQLLFRIDCRGRALSRLSSISHCLVLSFASTICPARTLLQLAIPNLQRSYKPYHTWRQ